MNETLTDLQQPVKLHLLLNDLPAMADQERHSEEEVEILRIVVREEGIPQDEELI